MNDNKTTPPPTEWAMGRASQITPVRYGPVQAGMFIGTVAPAIDAAWRAGVEAGAAKLTTMAELHAGLACHAQNMTEQMRADDRAAAANLQSYAQTLSELPPPQPESARDGD